MWVKLVKIYMTEEEAKNTSGNSIFLHLIKRKFESSFTFITIPIELDWILFVYLFENEFKTHLKCKKKHFLLFILHISFALIHKPFSYQYRRSHRSQSNKMIKNRKYRSTFFFFFVMNHEHRTDEKE